MKMDKYIVKASKRKKRRTRRNLDEMRKRTLQVHGNNYNETMCKLVNPKVTSCITNSRLTLANKAIRSKTATRSLLLNLSKENNKNVIVLPIREVMDSQITNVNSNNNTVPSKVTLNLKSPLHKFTKIVNSETPDSTNLFTSSESEVINNITNYNVLSDFSSSASLSYVMHSDNSLYSEFMTNIVNYVQEFASDFLKTDTVFNEDFLQNLFCNENHTIPSFQTHDKTKLTVNGNDENISHYSKSHNDISNSKSHNDISNSKSLNDISIQYTLKQPWSGPSPVFQQSNEIKFQKCILSSSSACSGKDTPEYYYYPHRLNH